MKISSLIVLLALGTVPFAAYADGSVDPSRLSTLINSGEWQKTVTRWISIPGTTMRIPPKTLVFKECVTREDLANLKNFLPKTPKGVNCKMTQQSIVGKTFTFTVKCSGKKGYMNLHGKTVFDTKNTSHSHIDIKTVSQMPMNIAVKVKAKRIGECTAAPSPSSGN